MKPFKEMDPDVVRKLVEGQENVVKPAVEKEQQFFKTSSCPNCSAYEVESRVNTKRPFIQGSILANKILVCLCCGTEFEPYTKVISRPPTA